MARRTIRIEPFGDTAQLDVATGERDRDRLVREFGVDDATHYRAWVQAIRPQSGGALILVSLPEKRCASTLHHEALHVAIELMHIHGLPIDYETQEFMCYMQEYIVREIDKALYTKPRGQRKRSMPK